MPSPNVDAGSRPDYARLLQFLIQPFLEQPDSLRIDCEVAQSRPRVWLRVAFDREDKGRVFGRGGRNIQAIRAVLNAAASLAGDSVYLDVYGGSPGHGDSDESTNGAAGRPQRRGGRGRPRGRSR